MRLNIHGYWVIKGTLNEATTVSCKAIATVETTNKNPKKYDQLAKNPAASFSPDFP